MRIAIVDGTTVRNIVEWDGTTPWVTDVEWHELMPGEDVGPGWTYRPGSTPRFREPPE